MSEKPNLDGWDDFSGDFLKCENVKEFPLIIVPVDVESEFRDGKPKLSVVFEYQGKNRKMGINKTNQEVIKKNNLSPRGIIGKKLTFSKIKVRDPTKNAMVDSFFLEKIE